MAIEFYCLNCNKPFSVTGESPDKKSKCPECGTVLEIPMPSVSSAKEDYVFNKPSESSNPYVVTERPGQRSDMSFNPYQSPESYETETPSRQSVGSGDIVPTKMELKKVLSLAWAIFESRMGLIIGSVLLWGILGLVGGQIADFMGNIAVQEMGDAGYLVVVIAQLCGYIFSVFMNIGQTKLILNIARRRKAEIGQVFSGGPVLVPAVLTSIVFALMVFGGFILLIIPGIIVALMFSQIIYLTIDRNVGVRESLTLSKQVTDGNKMTLFLLGIVNGGIMLLGGLVCGIGMIFSAGYINVIVVVAYLTMTGQPITRP